MHEIEIRPCRPEDAAAVVDAWNRIFPAQDALPPRRPADWRWAFLENPAGPGEAVLALAGGEVVGQYACLPMRALREGETVTVGLVVDAFVLPGYRRALGRPGLVIHLARKLHAWYCGPRAERRRPGHVLLYGYPYPIWRIAQRYLGSEIVRDMDVLFREFAEGRPLAPAAPGFTIEESAGPPDGAAELWERVAPSLAFGLVRDPAYLRWRYAEHPSRRYRFFGARDRTGRLRALAVAVRGRYAVEDACILADWLAPPGDPEPELPLLHAIETRALADGARYLVAVFPQNDPRFLRFQRAGFWVGPPSHFLVMNTFKDHVRWLRDRWFFTLGDSDLV